jgi:hypothetical protein
LFIEANEGDVILFSSLLLHKTYENTTEKSRWAYVGEMLKLGDYDPTSKPPYFVVAKDGKSGLRVRRHPGLHQRPRPDRQDPAAGAASSLRGPARATNPRSAQGNRVSESRQGSCRTRHDWPHANGHEWHPRVAVARQDETASPPEQSAGRLAKWHSTCSTSNMRVSIVIDNYNYENYVAQTIDSALAQTHPDVEGRCRRRRLEGRLDGSDPPLCRPGHRDRQAQRRPGLRYNAGFSRATGDLVIFLDADDWLYPEACRRDRRAVANRE